MKVLFLSLRPWNSVSVVSSRAGINAICSRRYASSFGAVNVFDRNSKRRQKDRASLADDPSVYDYLRDAIASHIVDRVYDVSREFPIALDLGCGRGHIAKQLDRDMIRTLIQTDFSPGLLSQAPSDGVTHRVIADEEFLPFPSNTFDLITTSCNLHWVNDLPAAFKEMHRVLKPDGCVIGSMFTGDTLFELRCSLQLAQEEIEGGFSPHVSPFVQLTDLGSLLQGASFTLTTMDTDEIIVNYPSMDELMKDLKGMGESNAAHNRPHYIRRDTLNRARHKYKELYGNTDDDDDGGGDSVPATFQLLYFIGWKPDKSQKGPARRGSATASLTDLGNILSKEK